MPSGDAPIGESHALWNDPSRNRNPSSTRVVENFNHWRTHYLPERKSGSLMAESNENCPDSHSGSEGALPGNRPMPPEFQLMHPRRVRWSSWFPQPDGSMAHFSGFSNATPEQELWHRIHDPESGLHPDDLRAYRKSQRGPVSKFFARLKFWPTKAKAEGEFELPAFLRNMPD